MLAGPAGELESQGWRAWLQTIWPFWFSEEFSEDHVDFWEWWWSILQRIKNGGRIELWEFVCLLILGRGLGKSASTEAARVMRGAILNKGYSLIISETDDQATEHLGNARLLIEHPDSRLTEFYPGMAIADNADALKGMPTADRKEMFICKNGYILRAKGLSAKMRGLRVGILRPDDLNLDDIDDVNDSLAVSLNKLRLITSSILPVQARENVTITFSQNLISEHSVLNQILTGKSDALAERKVIGPTPAFNHLEISSDIDDTGKLRHIIEPSSLPSWSGLDIRRAQKFLNDSGLDTFKAEYQNEFDQFRSGRVIPEYNEKVQIITWSQFESVFGERRIPAHWKIKVGLDVGYSEGHYPHYSAWDFFATSGTNSPFPGLRFLYRSRSFKGVSIDDQAVSIQSDLWPDERIETWQMSHEKSGEMLTLRQKYNLPFQKFHYYKAEDGVAQWRHLSKADKTKPHPFKDDELTEDGYLLGRPGLYYIVEDGQERIARDDNGLRLFREQVSTWEYVPVKITEQGQTVQKPSKVNDDHCDAAKGTLALFGPGEKGLTKDERIERTLEEKGLAMADIEPIEDERDKLAKLQVRLIEQQALRKPQTKYPRVATRWR
jgi:hypothetical protein